MADDKGQEATAIAERPADQQVMSVGGVKLTNTSAVIPPKIKLDDFLKAVHVVSGVREASRFWLGDLLHYGETQGSERWGEKYTQAMDATGMAYGSLRNIVSVSGKFAPERRRSDLSWTHHSAVSALPAEEADELLQQAADNGWSVEALKQAVKDRRTPTGDPFEERDAKSGKAAVSDAQNVSGASTVELPPEVQPVATGDGEWGCNACDATFAEQTWHCADCGRHWPEALEDCPACVATETKPSTDGIADDEPEEADAVTGTVIEPSALDPDDATGSGVLMLVSRLAAASRVDPDDVYIEAIDATYKPTMATTMGELMSAQNYLQRLIERFSDATATAETPAPAVIDTKAQKRAAKAESRAVPKPGKPKRGAKAATAVVEPPADTEELDDLPEID